MMVQHSLMMAAWARSVLLTKLDRINYTNSANYVFEPGLLEPGSEYNW